ncbi:MAG: hypothetical protein ACTSQY_10935 [Candidatus Odinarchaeia archaeon]
MNKYKIEQKISTLAQCAVMENREKPASFEVEKIKFSHWYFNYREGWLGEAWVATSVVEAKDYRKAFLEFNKKLSKIISRISLIGQCYIEYFTEPFLIHKEGSDIAFLRYVRDRRPVGLMFTEKEKEALEILMKNKSIPDEFFYYWKDAVNTLGYSSKILLMCSAIEALTSQDKNLQKKILGDDLYKKVFGKGGIRHRLSHGSYFNERDFSENYAELLHFAIIKYFNKEVFHKTLISEKVKHPQRHFWGNKEELKVFIEKRNKNIYFSLVDVLNDLERNELFKNSNNSNKYKIIWNIRKY